MLEVRPLEKTDRDFLYGAVCDLEQTDFPLSAFNGQFQQALEPATLQYFIAHKSGNPIGYFALRIEHQLHHCALVAEIVEFYISPNQRNQGRGTALLKLVVDMAKQSGAILIEVASSLNRNDTHRFYEQFGFRQTHFRFSYPL